MKCHVGTGTAAPLILLDSGLAAWNAADELSTLRSWSQVLLVASLWTIPPAMIGLYAVFTQSNSRVRGTTVALVLLTSLYAFYALNGSSATHGEGAQQLHLYLVPFGLSGLVLIGFGYLGLRHLALRLFRGER